MALSKLSIRQGGLDNYYRNLTINIPIHLNGIQVLLEVHDLNYAIFVHENSILDTIGEPIM